MKRTTLVMIVTALVAACDQKPAAMAAADAPAVTSAEAAPALNGEAKSEATNGGVRFYGKERFTLVMQHRGSETGTTTLHVRDWGHLRAELKETSVQMAGRTFRTQTRAVIEGARITTTDLQTGQVTAMTNPIYAELEEAARGSDGVEIGFEILKRMGGRATGEKGAFLGEDCEYWEVSSLNSRACITSWGAPLYSRAGMAGMTVEQTATELRLGDGGPDEAFTYDASRVQEAPNPLEMLNKARGQ